VLSTAQPSLRELGFIIIIILFNNKIGYYKIYYSIHQHYESTI
jgi:hypothetical protein